MEVTHQRKPIIGDDSTGKQLPIGVFVPVLCFWTVEISNNTLGVEGIILKFCRENLGNLK